jgi:hypothetical protein
VITGRETRTEQSNGRQRQGTGRQPIEDHGEATADAGRLDSIAGGVLGEPQHFRAVREQRAVTIGGIQGRTRLELGQVGHELGRGLSLRAGEHADTCEEIVIGKAGRESEHVRIHDSLCITVIFSFARGSRRLPEARGRPSSAREAAVMRERSRREPARS